MKLLLLHGAGIASSRKKLTDFKKDFDVNDVTVLGEGASVEDIKNNLVSTPLFSTNRLLILENPPEDFIPYTLYPTSEGGVSSPHTLILWFDHEISEKKLSEVKNLKGEILFFPESKEVSVFSFLDFLSEGSQKAFLEQNRLKNAGFDIFYFITMVFYLLRNLTFTPKNAPAFVANKLQKQRKRFNEDDIKKMYRRIIEIEFKLKSGLLDTKQAEFLLVNSFS